MIDQLYWLEKDERLGMMCSKALELGYVWDVSKYPTPAWCFDKVMLEYNNPLFEIPVDVWNRELRLWACDCVEHVLPIWEEWARMYAPEHVNTARNTLQANRDYAYGKVNENKLMHCCTHAFFATQMISLLDSKPYRAISAVYVVASKYPRSCFHAVAYVELTRTEKAEKEKVWKRDDLGQRLDNFAPWGME